MPTQKDSNSDNDAMPRGKHARVESEEETPLSEQETTAIKVDDAAISSMDETQVLNPADVSGEGNASEFAGTQYADAQFGVGGVGGVAMPKDHTKAKKIACIVAGIVVGVLLVIYLAGVAIFSDRLFPNTTMGDLDVSMQTSSELRQTINKRVDGYTLTITNPNGFSLKVSSSDVGLVSDDNVNLNQMAQGRNIWAWPIEIFRSHEISKAVDTSYNYELAQSVIGSAVDTYNATATQPKNASLTFNSTKNTFEVVAEVKGTALDKDVVIQKAIAAMADVQEKLVLGDDSLLQPSVLSTDSRIASAVASANTMIQANVTYTMGGVEVAKLTPSTISGLITIDDQCNASLDTEKLNAWIEQTVAPLNTTGSKRTYTRPDGKVITVEGGSYGWEVDSDAFAEQIRADVAEGATKTVAIPCSEEGEGFTAVGGADWGKRYVDVDLSEQHVRFYDASGALIWEADCISGAPTNGHATPQGVWYVVTKESPSKLIGYAEDGKTKEYETEVQYWMPFEGVGVGFHDATWQPSFGGTMYADGYGSHGCINLSYSSAESLYGIIEPNDVVVVHE